MRVIAGRRLKGLAPLLLELLPLWQETYLLQAATKAVEVSAERDDARFLRATLAGSKSGPVRVAAAAALAAALRRDAQADLIALLDDAEPGVSLAAATALLNQGSRRPLAALVRLLDAKQPEARLAAVTILQAVSGRHFDYISYDDPQRQAAAVAAWRDWVSWEGRVAALRLPVRPRPVPRGRILIAVYNEKVLREIDAASGKKLFEAGGGFNYLWGCHATPEGHRLVVDYAQRLVVEYDAAGKECWRHKLEGGPTGVERLPDGRTLIALAEPGRVVELDRTGKEVWGVTLDGRPTTAQRLPNGNTLVNLQFSRKVVEIDRKGTVVWAASEGLRAPHTAQQLDNGHVLVCDFGGPGAVYEFDRAGKVVWSKVGINNPAQAQRLANGNTLISGADGLTEYDSQGNVVRRVQVGRSKFFAY
jgi:hypothetical protein